MKTSRREFLLMSAASLCALDRGAALNPASHAAPRKSIIVDTHIHCFAGDNDARFPYHERAPYRRAETATPQHLLQCMDDAGIAFGVIVHPEPYQDDHRYLEYCLDAGKGRLKGTALVFADRAGSMDQLPDLAKRLGVVTVRVHAYAPDRLPPFGKPELRRLWKLASDLGLAVQLHFEPRHAPGFEPLIREFSETTVIIDHLGRPFQGTPEEHDRVVRWSELKNTIMKVSSLPSPEAYPHRDVQPILRRLAKAFGADRMIYGGGYGREATGASYRAAIERGRALLGFLPQEEQDKVMGANAARIFRF